MRRPTIIAATALTIASITIGAIAGMWSNPTTNPTTGRASAHMTVKPDVRGKYAYNAMPNLTMPFLSEDRYVDGAWIGNPMPTNLPHTSGTCIDCP